MSEIRKLEQQEIPFWNGISIGILTISRFVFELNDGKIVGIGYREEEERC